MLNIILNYKTYIKYWLTQYNLYGLLKIEYISKYSWIILNISLIIFIYIFKPKSDKLFYLERRNNIFVSTKSTILFFVKFILFLISLYFLIALKLNYKYL
jgi:preprotein translocase subunit SecG